MIFWPISERRFYANGQVYPEFQPEFTTTWEYEPFLSGRELTYACYHAGARYNSSNLTNTNTEVEKYKKANSTCRIDYKFLERTLPEHVLFPILEARISKIQEILETPRSEEYDFLLNFRLMIDDIAKRPLNVVKATPIELMEPAERRFHVGIAKKEHYVKYSKERGITGRLKLEPNSFPVHNLTKEHRSVLVPNNDLFVELDYNAMDLRCIYGLCGMPQEEEDPYVRLNTTHFSGSLERSEIKRRVYAFAYDDKSTDPVLGGLFSKHTIMRVIRDRNLDYPAGKEIAFLVQRTSSDVVLRAKVRLFEALRGKRSYVAFSVHDSVVLDFAREDAGMLQELITMFQETQFGKFRVNVKMGKSLGSLVKVP